MSEMAAAVSSKNIFWPEQPLETVAESQVSDDNEEEGNDDDLSSVLDSIVKIHCTHSEPDYLIPWQKQHQSGSFSSGFVISLLPNQEDDNNHNNEHSNSHHNKRIMTNAHAVEYGSMVQVQRRGEERKYEAIVEHMANECDLAILRIKDEKFWHGDLQALEFGASLPALQTEVEVLGYPTGGDSLSITHGVVSRIERLEYTQASTRLLAMQVDAAINPGNSGGPVINEDLQVIGIAFQGLDEAQNIGYVVPVTVIQHVLHDIQKSQKYNGFCKLGVDFACLENKAFRKSLGMIKNDNEEEEDDDDDSLSGVMIKTIEPTSPCKNVLKPKDVILKLDGIPVANDGKIPFRPGERVSLTCYIQTHFIGDTVQVRVLRERQQITLDCPVNVIQRLVPAHFGDQSPPYLIVAGLVFTALSIPYLEASRAWDDYVSDNISNLLGKVHEPLEHDSDQIVVLAQVLAHRENLGYDHLADLCLEKVNGQPVRSLSHLKSLIDTIQDEYLQFEFQLENEIVVLERSQVEQATKDICKEHSVQYSYCFR